MTNIDASYEFNLNDRMRSISTNAVQEARVAKGRGSLPFLDKDARIQHMIERLLHELTASSDIDSTVEHYPLVEKDQPLIGKKLNDMTEILDKLEDEIIAEDPKPLVNASLPKVKRQ